MERRQKVHSIWSEEEVIVVHDGEPVSVVDSANGVVKCHGLDVEAGQDGLLVGHGGVIMGGHLGTQDDTHVTQVDVDSSQVGSAQRRSLRQYTIQICVSKDLSLSDTVFTLTWRIDILGRFCSVFHSLLRYSTLPKITTCLSS